jgi:SAM-dependent methyltransferase
MDRKTSDFYDRYASEGAPQEARESAISRYFSVAFSNGSRVLDVGSGSGRDLETLLKQGYDAYGVEPNASMRSLAMQINPELRDRLLPGTLPNIGQPFGGQFNGILCGAVLMHITDPDLAGTMNSMRGLLMPQGRLLLSLPTMSDALIQGDRGNDGRLFKNHSPEHLETLLEEMNFRKVSRWDSEVAMGTGSIRWHTLLSELN